MRKLTLLTTLGLSLLLMSSCNSKVSDEALTEENYLHEDSLLWIAFNNETEDLFSLLENQPESKDSIIDIYNAMIEEANRKNIALAFKYASTPSGLARLFMTRNYIDKDTLRQVLASLPNDMQKSKMGLNIKAHLDTEQLSVGSTLVPFPCVTEENVEFDWNQLKGKQILLLYGGLGCMGDEGREYLKTLYKQTNREDLEIVLYWPSSSIEDLKSVKEHYVGNDYAFVSDFKLDASPIRIKYGCQATPTCFFTDKDHIIVVKSEGLNIDEFEKHIKRK